MSQKLKSFLSVPVRTRTCLANRHGPASRRIVDRVEVGRTSCAWQPSREPVVGLWADKKRRMKADKVRSAAEPGRERTGYAPTAMSRVVWRGAAGWRSAVVCARRGWAVEW